MKNKVQSKGYSLTFLRKKRTFERQVALSGITFDIQKGDFFGIVGRNGSGKSTLLKLLAEIYSPSKGAIQVHGKLTPFIELGVGFNPELTGRENVFLNGALLGFNRAEMLEMYEDIVEFAELERFMDQKLKNYSSGMQVRLAFSIAIRAQSDILLIDEVLAVGDAVFQAKCYEYFRKLKNEGRTVVFVSHDSDALLRFCDRGILITDGEQSFIGPIKEVVNKYKQLLISEDRRTNKTDVPGFVDIEKVEIINSKQEATKKITSGESVRIKLKLKHSEKTPEMINVAVGIYDRIFGPGANHIFGASTQLDKVTIKGQPAEVVLKIDKPQLRNGVYYVYTVLFGETEEAPYYYSDVPLTFTVKGGPETTARGVLLNEHDWSIE